MGENSAVKTHVASAPIDYDGTQIRSLWAYREFGVQGDSIVAFRGACEIPKDLKPLCKISGRLLQPELWPGQDSCHNGQHLPRTGRFYDVQDGRRKNSGVQGLLNIEEIC